MLRAAQQMNFFTRDGKKTSLLRLLRNKFLTGLCMTLALLTLIPLVSIVYLVIRNAVF